MRGLVRLAAVVFCVGAGLPVRAQAPEMPMGKWWKHPRVVQMLQLGPEQQVRMEEIFAKNRRAFIDLRADVERRQLDLEELLTKKDSDPKKVSSAIEALDQAKLRLGKTRAMMFVEMRAILTAEQWQKVLERQSEFRRERDQDRRFGRRHGFGGGREGMRGDREAEERPQEAVPPKESPPKEPPPQQ